MCKGCFDRISANSKKSKLKLDVLTLWQLNHERNHA
jgi:hypothetical protein